MSGFRGLKAPLFCASMGRIYEKTVLTMRLTKILISCGFVILLAGCASVEGFKKDVNAFFSGPEEEDRVVYSNPPVPLDQVDLTYDRVAGEISNRDVQLFSLDGPGQAIRPARQYAGAGGRVSAGTGGYGFQGMPSSTDPSVTVFPFTADMYTPGVKPGYRIDRPYPASQGAGYTYLSVDNTGAHYMTDYESVPMYVGSPNKIYFNHGSAALSATARQVVASVAQQAYGRMINVEGHASHRAQVKDPDQRARVNYRMSMKRAMAVTKALIAQGVPKEMIKTTARGDTMPAAEEIDRQAEALNRRVEILTGQ